MNKQDKPYAGIPISIALSGSGFLYPAHVGALVALNELGFDIMEIAGTSGGAIVGGLYAASKDLDWLTHIALHKDFSSFMSFNYLRLLFQYGLCPGHKVFDFLHSGTKGITFRDLELDLKIIATDTVKQNAFVFSKKTTPNLPVALAQRASSSVPIIFSPVKLDGKVLVDGGLSNDIPGTYLKGDNIRIAIDIDEISTGKHKTKGWVAYGANLINSMLASSNRANDKLLASNFVRLISVTINNLSFLDNNLSAANKRYLFGLGRSAVHSYFFNKELKP